MNDQVLIGITCRDYEHYLPDCLMSVAKQTVRCPILVAHDNCGNLCPAGVAAMRNSILCSDIADVCRYVIFLDADDMIPPNYVEELLRVANGNDCVVACPAAMFGTQTGEIWPKMPVTVDSLLEGNTLHCSQLIPLYVCDIKYDCMLTAYEDWDLWLQLVQYGIEFRYTDKTNLMYRRHAGSRDHQFNHTLEETRALFKTKYGR